MSHTSSIKGMVMTDINALKAAVADLASQGIKVSIIPDATPRAYYTDQKGLGRADFVIKLADAPYDVGIYATKTADGRTTYEARTDFWGQHVERILGVPCSDAALRDQSKLGKLFQAYGVQTTMNALRAQGKTPVRQRDAAGNEKLTIQF